MQADAPPCRCALFTTPSASFTHEDAPCGWPDLAALCPDCRQEGENCSFFSENAEENGCAGFTRIVALCIRCQLDGAKRRLGPQVQQRVVALSGGEESQRAVAFARGHFETYKEALKLVDGVWIPQDLTTPETEFFWDRNVQPWRFLTEPQQGAEPVTMRGLLGALGAVGAVGASGAVPDHSAFATDLAMLKAQVQELTQLVTQLTQGVAANATVQPQGDAATAAQQAKAVLNQARASASPTATPRAASWNPSHTFTLGAGSAVGSNASITNNSSSDVELAQLLASQGASADQIIQFLQTRRPGQTEHRNAWCQVMEGTSPLCVYTGMRGETRQAAQTKTLNVQTQDGSSKLTMKHTVWPAARAEDVALFRIRELSDSWKRELAQGNQRMINITPPPDRALVPRLPVDVDRFLEQILAALDIYEHGSVLRAWEAAHHYVVDEYISKRGQPSWDLVWISPVFQGQLVRAKKEADGAVNPRNYCVNWNMRSGQKCSKDPDAACSKLHVCLRCGGSHRFVECPRD